KSNHRRSGAKEQRDLECCPRWMPQHLAKRDPEQHDIQCLRQELQSVEEQHRLSRAASYPARDLADIGQVISRLRKCSGVAGCTQLRIFRGTSFAASQSDPWMGYGAYRERSATLSRQPKHEERGMARSVGARSTALKSFGLLGLLALVGVALLPGQVSAASAASRNWK